MWTTYQFTSTLFEFILSHKIQISLKRDFSEKDYKSFQLVNWLHGCSALNENDDRLHVNGNNWNDNNRSHAFGIALIPKTFLKPENAQAFWGAQEPEHLNKWFLK